VPETLAPATGAVTETDGGVVSFVLRDDTKAAAFGTTDAFRRHLPPDPHHPNTALPLRH